MTVPTAITDLSTTAASNDPQGSESVFPSLDDYLRAAYKFIADLYTGSVSLVQVDVTGSATFNGATEVTKSGAATNLDVTADSTYAANLRLAGNATTAGTTSLDLYQGASSVGYLYNRANAALNIGTNNTARVVVAATGGVTINAPTTGIALVANGVAGTSILTCGANSVSCSVAYESSSAIYAGTTTTNTYGLMTDTTPRVLIGPGGNVTINAPVSGYALNLPSKTPSSASDTGAAGDWSADANYIYICTATNTWKRAAIATW